MRFWDSSALVPLFLWEKSSARMEKILKKDPEVAAWWGSRVECVSAFARLVRSGALDREEERQSRHVLDWMAARWTEIEPGEKLRSMTERLLFHYPLRAADALQLAAALTWANEEPKGREFVCLDEALREAAYREGFLLLPLQR